LEVHLKKLIVIAVFLIGAIFFITQKYYALRIVNVVGACSHQQISYNRAFYNPFTSSITFKEFVLENADYKIISDRVKAFDLHRAEGKIILPAYFIAENTDIQYYGQSVEKIEVNDIISRRLPDNTISLSAVIKNLSLNPEETATVWHCRLY
jgi:hypothetical protein